MRATCSKLKVAINKFQKAFSFYSSILQMIIADSSRQEKWHHATHEYYGKFIVIVIVASEVHISLSLSFQQREVPSHYDINKFAFH